ncbi:alpha/beta hydrolase [Spirosoma knui]
MRTLLQLLVFGGLLALSSCKDKDTNPREDATLFLRHKGANMPIWVKGNQASNKLILFLHGGPGDCAMCYRYYLNGLEDDVMMAYWDQRVAGSSSGKVEESTLRYAQFNEDMELVVKLLQKQYPKAKIYLLAHSFGVELAWQYLTTPNNQQHVAGLITVNGMFSFFRWLYQVREWALREARLQKNSEAEAYLVAHPVTSQQMATIDWESIYRWMYKLGGNPVSLYSDRKFVLDYAFNSPNTALAQFTQADAYRYYGDVESRTYEKGALLQNVRVPVGLFWGTKDGIVPYEVSQETKALLTNTKVTSVSFSESWHEPFITENRRFIDAVRTFVLQQ